MLHLKRTVINFAIITIAIFSLSSCSKKDSIPTPADVCAGKTIVITATPSGALPCGGTNGSIEVAATGSTGFTFKLNSTGTYQSSGTFNNIAAGGYTVFAKDAAGCEKSVSVTVAAAGTAGTLFTAVKNLLASRCQGCHNNTLQSGNMNWAEQCNVIAKKDRIKVRAVDQGTMPQGGPELTTVEKNIITDWINAGGGFAN